MVREGDYVRNVKAHIAYVLDGKDIDISNSVVRVSVDEIACSGNVLKMGEFCKNSVEFEYKPSLLENPNIFWNNKKIKVSMQYEYIYPSEDSFPSPESLPITAVGLGEFYVSSVDVETSNNGNTYVITAYDVPSKMSDHYAVENSPNNSLEILDKVALDTGMNFYNKELISSFDVDSIPEGTTYAGIVAYIAGYDGYNVRVNSTGYIEFYWFYDASIDQNNLYTITRKDQYLGGFKNKEELPSINAISSGKGVTDSNEDGVVYTAGSGEALTYQNPYITQEKVDEIYNRVKGFKYCVGEIKWRGDQLVRAGDLVRVETKKDEYVLFPVMEYSMTFDGGMIGNSASFTYIVDNNVMGSAPTDKKIEVAYKNLTEAFKKQTGIVKMNAKGGFYRLLIDDETGFPYGWVVSDSEEITETTKGWMWTKGGLMHSSDGFRTADKVAFTEDGQLSAEMISANSVSFGKLSTEVLEKIDGAYDHAEEVIDSQTQKDIFDKLTNNGQVKGIALEGNELFMNATYIKTGTLDGSLIKADSIQAGQLDPQLTSMINTSVASDVTLYCLTTDRSVFSEETMVTEWNVQQPIYQSDTFYWQKHVITKGDGTVIHSDPVQLSSATAQTEKVTELNERFDSLTQSFSADHTGAHVKALIMDESGNVVGIAGETVVKGDGVHILVDGKEQAKFTSTYGEINNFKVGKFMYVGTCRVEANSDKTSFYWVGDIDSMIQEANALSEV